MLGVIQHLVLAVNKMDLIDWDRTGSRIRDEFHAFAARLDVTDVTTIPMSALHGDNVVTSPDKLPGTTVRRCCSHLEDVYIAVTATWSTSASGAVRHPPADPRPRRPSQLRRHGGRRIMRPATRWWCCPASRPPASPRSPARTAKFSEAFPPMAVSINLADDIDISPGTSSPDRRTSRGDQEFDAMVCWMADDATLEPGRDYVIKHTTRSTRARVTGLDYRLDVNTLHRDKGATALKLNEIGRVSLRTQFRCCSTSTPKLGDGLVHPDRPRHQRPSRPAWC